MTDSNCQHLKKDCAPWSRYQTVFWAAGTADSYGKMVRKGPWFREHDQHSKESCETPAVLELPPVTGLTWGSEAEWRNERPGDPYRTLCVGAAQVTLSSSLSPRLTYWLLFLNLIRRFQFEAPSGDWFPAPWFLSPSKEYCHITQLPTVCSKSLNSFHARFICIGYMQISNT